MDALQLLSQQSEAKLGLMLETLSPDSEKEKEVRSQLLALKDAFEVTIEDEGNLFSIFFCNKLYLHQINGGGE